MTEREDEAGAGIVISALASIALVALAIVYSGDALDGASRGMAAGSLSGLSTMSGVEALYADQGASGVPLVAATKVAEADIPRRGEALVGLPFEPGSSALPADAERWFATTIDALRARPGAIAVISGFYDGSGSAVANAAMSRRRVQAVATALAARGVPPHRLLLREPASTLGDGGGAGAHRVEVRVQGH
ncbi:MAG: OmpA family protein [Rhodocyclaceae bacterium]|nr:OmpA family protein [Rhodocyclaceae bacterium]